MVDKRCAITTTVLFFIISSNACFTKYSDSVSNADVASSSNNIFGSINMALAIAILCFCPPLNRIPLSPTNVSNLFGNLSINSYAFAFFVASIIFSISILS
mmetsp:Transcript_13828/g.17045  ORF Transcript_13828/g.17045 Transcript_13828/m.17045 type:complete len:101 (-) Transcript_13828:235-537(-)